MTRFNPDPGDTVRIDIPDESDVDHEYHGEHGTVIDVLQDDASTVTGRADDSVLYRVEFQNGDTQDFRGRDVRPPFRSE